MPEEEFRDPTTGTTYSLEPNTPPKDLPLTHQELAAGRAEIVRLRKNVRQLLAAAGWAAYCRGKGCRKSVIFVKHQNGKTGVYDYDGTSHFATCKDSKKFKGK